MTRRKRARHVITLKSVIPGFEEETPSQVAGKLQLVAFGLTVSDLRTIWEFEQLMRRTVSTHFSIDIQE